MSSTTKMKQKTPRRSKRYNIRSEDQAIIAEFMTERDLPQWFRGLSKFQMEAADSLLNSIRDDSEQGTSHRVRDALIKLGIEPLVSRPKIKLAMRLSRGNDMAFLWFLMELYYRHACDACDHAVNFGYTVNEQVIMSTIAHLDTIPTLRELDKLLPKQPPKPKVKKIRKKKEVKPDYALPYFEALTRPEYYGKSLTLQGGNNMAFFGEYDLYMNANHVVPNECNRWFANYKLNKGQRIAKGIINEQIDNIFNQEDIGNGLDAYSRNPIYCAHHETMEAIKDNMDNELKVAKKKACEKYFDLDGRLKDQSFKRVVDQLNKEIDEAGTYIKKVTDANMRMEQIAFGLEDNLNRSEAVPRSSAGTKSFYDEYFEKYDFGHATPTLSDKTNFFERPCHHKPFKFNYNKIFDLGPKNPINEAVTTALDGGSSDMSLEHSRAVKKCAKNMWTSEVKKFKAEYAQKEKELKKQKPPAEEGLGFDLPYYDPRDKDLMAKMLFKAIQEIKKNKKFVLASLPEAHKVPILKEFIRKRYGMVYTKEEKIQAFKESKKIFHLLKRDQISIKIPELYDLSHRRIVSYGCKDYILRKTNYLKENYQHNFRVTFLENTRIYWGAVRPYQCSKGPPRNEFFAYLPARENDVHMFRPWKVGEYIRAKEEWDRRQKIKRQALLY